MPDTQKIARGTPAQQMPSFNAAWQNNVSDMLNWFNRAKASGEIASGNSGLEDSSGRVRIKNLTSEDLLRGHYVQLGDYLLTDVDHTKHWFEGNLYAESGVGLIAVLEKASKSGDAVLARARIIGKCTARVDVTDITHRFAVPNDGEVLLKSAASGGIEILSCSKIVDTGEQEVAVLLGGGGGGGGGTLRWGDITHLGSPSLAKGVPSEDGELTLFEDFGGAAPGLDPITVTFKNYFSDEVPAGKVGCIDGNNVIVDWSCNNTPPDAE